MERPYKFILVISLLLVILFRLPDAAVSALQPMELAGLVLQTCLWFLLFAFVLSALYYIADVWAGKMRWQVAKPHRVILLLSVLLPVILYLIDILWLDPVLPVPGWKYRVTNFTQCLFMYGLAFYFLLTAFYYVQRKLTQLIRK